VSEADTGREREKEAGGRGTEGKEEGTGEGKREKEMERGGEVEREG